MINISLKFLFFTILILVSGQYAIANDELKTSSLSIEKVNNYSKISQACQKFFKESEKLISDIEKQPGTHIQLSEMKSKLSASKQKILKMEPLIQKKSCDQGLIALNQLKNKY